MPINNHYLTEAVVQLERVTDYPEIQENGVLCLTLKTLIKGLKELQFTKPIELNEKVEQLRAGFNALFFKSPQSKGYALVEIHAALIALADIQPINDVDDISLEEIPEEEKIVFSSGRQYNVYTLLTHLRVNEQHSVSLSDATLGQSFSVGTHHGVVDPLDVAHFNKMLRQMNIKRPKIRGSSFSNSTVGGYVVSSLFTLIKGEVLNHHDTSLNITYATHLLSEHGVTLDIIKSLWRRKDACNDFTQEHALALQYLIVEKGLDIKHAFDEINDLNEHQVSTLKMLYEKGARRSLLREWANTNTVEFKSGHEGALVFLTSRLSNPLTFEQALLEIDQLDETQAQSLVSLFHLGLRGAHFAYMSGKWFWEYTRLFTMLVTEEHLTPVRAVMECNALGQAAAMTLLEFYAQGLSGVHLRRANYWNENRHHLFSKLFVSTQLTPQEIVAACMSIMHDGLRADIFIHLVNQKGLSADNALEMTKSKSDEQLLTLGNYLHWIKYHQVSIFGWLVLAKCLSMLPQTAAYGLAALTFMTMGTEEAPHQPVVELPIIEQHEALLEQAENPQVPVFMPQG